MSISYKDDKGVQHTVPDEVVSLAYEAFQRGDWEQVAEQLSASMDVETAEYVANMLKTITEKGAWDEVTRLAGIHREAEQ